MGEEACGCLQQWSLAFRATNPFDSHESYIPTPEKDVHMCQAVNVGSVGSDSQPAHGMTGVGGLLSPVLRFRRPGRTHKKASTAWDLTSIVPLEWF